MKIVQKWLALVLITALALSLSACGDGDPKDKSDSGADNDLEKATIITNEGDTVTMTAEELIDAYDSNEASFNKLYQYAQIEFTGTVRNIKVDTSVLVESGTILSHQNKIVFEEGWSLALSADNTAYDLADFNTGDVVQVTTAIFGAPFDTEFLQKASDEERVLWLVGDDIRLSEFERNDIVFYNSGVTTVIEPAEETQDDSTSAAG